MSNNSPEINVYNGVYAYVEATYKDQAADEGIKWTQEHNEFVEEMAQALFAEVGHSIDLFMSHFAEPLPDFEDDSICECKECNAKREQW